jgi:Flp pilus assembly protein TadG
MPRDLSVIRRICYAEHGAVLIEASLLLGLILVIFTATYDILRAIEVKTIMTQAAAIAAHAGATDETLNSDQVEAMARSVLRDSGLKDEEFMINVRLFDREPISSTPATPQLFSRQMLQVAISLDPNTHYSLSFRVLTDPCVASVVYTERPVPTTSMPRKIANASCNPGNVP